MFDYRVRRGTAVGAALKEALVKTGARPAKSIEHRAMFKLKGEHFRRDIPSAVLATLREQAQ